MRSCVQQFYASAGHGVQDGIQSARPRKPSRVHHRRQCAISLLFSLRASRGVGGHLFIIQLTRKLTLEAQVNTQEYGRRPYGVGFLVIGLDHTGPHLYEFSPSGTSFEYFAVSIGARSQSAKTYLEKHFESFADCTVSLPFSLLRVQSHFGSPMFACVFVIRSLQAI
jgi:hypothetical protein